MYELIDSMIKAMEKDAVVSKNKPKTAQSLRRAVAELAAHENAKVPAERRVTLRDVETVAARSLNKTASLERSSRFFAAYKDVASFIVLATTGTTPTRVASNTDLLPIGHPLSTRKHAMTASAYSETVARWIAADPRVHDDARAVVAAAYRYPAGTVEYAHAVTRLLALEPGMVPQELLVSNDPSPITASFMGWLRRIFGGGNSRTARSLRAKAQLRDREGKFAEQGGGMQFYVLMPDGTYKSKVGDHAGNSANGTDFIVEMSGDPDLPDGLYSVPANMTKAIKAIIPGDDAGSVSLPEGVEAVSLESLQAQRKDAPDGWKLIKEKGEGESGPDKVYATDDGYEVEVYEGGNYGKEEMQKAYKFNAGISGIPGSPVGDFTKRIDFEGRPNMAGKFDTSKPLYNLYRVETPETKRQAVLMAQRWSDVQQEAELDQDKFEKFYDASEKYNAEIKAKQEKSAAESKASQEAFEKKAAEVAKQNEQTRAEIESNLAKGLDPFGNKIPDGWTVTKNDGALNPAPSMKVGDKEFVTTPIKKEDTVSYERTEQGYTGTLSHTADGGLKGLYQDQEFKNWDEAQAGFAETVEADVDARRERVLDIVEQYDDSGEIRDMIENGANGNEVLEKLKENDLWKSRYDDWETSGAVDLPSQQQKADWKKFGDNLKAIQNLPPEFTPFDTKVEATLPEEAPKTKPAAALKPGDKIIHDGKVKTVKKRFSMDTGDRVEFEEGGVEVYDIDDVVELAPSDEAQAPSSVESTATDFSKRYQELKDLGDNPDPNEFFSALFKDAKSETIEEYLERNPNDEYAEAPEGSKVFYMDQDSLLVQHPDGTWHDYMNGDDNVFDWSDPDLRDSFMEGFYKELMTNDGEPSLRFYQGAFVDEDLQKEIEDKRDQEPIIEEDEGDQEDGDAETPAPATPPSVTPSAKSAAPEKDIEWILPDGAYNLWKADEYEPEGRTDQESSDYTDDPKVLANKFSAEQLKDALAQAIIGVKDYAAEFLDEFFDDLDDEEEGEVKKKPGPKKKKPKAKQASGFGQLDFDFGDEYVPAEAIYSALKEQGEDAEMIAAELYDLPLGESKNVDMLEDLRTPEEVKAQEPSTILDDFDEDAMDIAETNIAVAQGDAAATATGQMNEVIEGGEQNVYINDLATDLNSTGVQSSMQGMLDKYIALALSDNEDENQAYQALHSVLLSADGGLTIPGEQTMLFDAVGNALETYNGSAPTPEEISAIFDKYGYYKDLILSKKAIAEGDESINDKNSKAGALYRLVVAGGKPNPKPLYRGIQVPLDSDAFEKYTNEGGVVSLDARSFADYPQMAEKFAGAFTSGNTDKASVIFTMPAGLGKALDITKVSPFGDERESLGFGNYRITKLKIEKDPASGKTLVIVRLEALDKRSELLEGLREDYNNVLLENDTVELPESYYTPQADPFENMDAEVAQNEEELDAIQASDPLYIARAYEMEDLLGAFRGAVEDGTGKVQLIDDDKEYSVDVEAVRDALQIQGINTNEVLKDIASAEPDVEVEEVDDEPIEPVSGSPLDEIITEFGQEYDLEGFEQVGPQQGSNKGGTFKDAEGNEYYVKQPKSETHRRNELLASAFYKLAGVNAAEMRFGSANDGEEKIFSSIIPGTTLADTDLTPETKKQIQEGFAIDAWLANWDVAGLVNDNIIVDEDGKAFRIDTGGALLFRAMGAPKGSTFGSEVTELDTLRNAKMNPTSAALFGDMTDEDLKASASKLLDISHTDIDNLVDATFDGQLAQELKDKLKARRNYILERYGLLGDDTSLIAETTKVEEPEAPEAEVEEPEQPTPPAPDVPSDAPGNPYVTSDGVPIEPGMQVIYKKTGETSTVIKYDKGNSGYVYVQLQDGSIKNKSTKQLASVVDEEAQEAPVADEVAPEPEAPSAPEVPQEETPEQEQEPASLETIYTKVDRKVEYLAVGDLIPKYYPIKGAEENIYKKRAADPDFELEPADEITGVFLSASNPKKYVLEVRDLKTGKTRKFAINKSALMMDVRTPAKPPKVVEPTLDNPVEELPGDQEVAEAPQVDITDEIIQQESQEQDQVELAKADPELERIYQGQDLIANKFKYKNGTLFFDYMIDRWSVRYGDEGKPLGKVSSIAEGKKLIDDEESSGGGGGTTPDSPEPEAPTPAAPEPDVAAANTTVVIDTTKSVENAVNQIKTAIENKETISFFYSGKVRNMKPESIWENPKNGKINVYGEDLGDNNKKKNFTVQLMEALPETSPNKPEAVEAQTPEAEAEPKKLQFHAQWIKDVMASKGVPITDEKAVEIRDIIDNNQLLEKWSSADESDLIDALDEALGPDWNDAVGNVSDDDDDVEDPLLSDEQRQIIVDMIQKLAGIEGFPTEKFVNQISDPSLTEADGAKLLEELEGFDEQLGGQPKVEAPGSDVEALDEDGDQEPEIAVGAQITDKKGKKGTITKGPNKDNYVFVQFDDGTTGWRSVGSVSTTGEFNESVGGAKPKSTAGKITPAGTKAVFVENPAGWDTSDFENVPPLTDAIALVQNPDDKSAAMKGASAAIDADSIEDLDVRIMRVRDAEGNDGLRLKFKLTAWAGNAKAKELLSLSQAQLDEAGITRQGLLIDRIDIGPDGVGQISKTKNAYSTNGGFTWTITTKDGIVVKFNRANKDDTSKLSVSKYSSDPVSFHNLVQIQAPADATNEQIADALLAAGVADVRPATKADAQVLIENRLMSVFDGKVDATKNPKGADRQASLQRVKDKYGITVDDVVLSTGASGRIETRITPEGAQKIIQATGSPTAIKHSIKVPDSLFYGQSDPSQVSEAVTDYYANLLSTPQGGLLSTTTRWTEGIGAHGQSSTADIGTGGAEYVFTKPVKVADAAMYGTSGMVMYFDPVKLYQRLDFYANFSDEFGKRKVNQDIIKAAQVGAYEVMFKHRIGFEALDTIVISTQAHRTALITKLRQLGITEIGGKPLEAAIISPGNK